MKKALSYLLVFVTGFVLAVILVLKVTAGVNQQNTEGVIHLYLGYIELLDNPNFVIDKNFLVSEAEVALSTLGYNLDDIFYSCTEDTEQLLRRARKYVDEDKIPLCD